MTTFYRKFRKIQENTGLPKSQKSSSQQGKQGDEKEMPNLTPDFIHKGD